VSNTDKNLTVEFDEKKIDAIFAVVNQCRLPGAAVGIAIGGKPVYRKGFGLASMELPLVLSPSIRMRIGSTTKHFTCLAYMLLCEDGQAGIDDSVGQFLPELHPVTRKITMRQLMGNIGGLRDSFDIYFQFSGTGRLVSCAEQLSFYRDIDDVNFAPGTSWCYCNGGFLLLSVAIERITGQSLEDVLRERIFEPIGMNDTLLRRLDNDFVPNSATLHAPHSATGSFEKPYVGAAMVGDGGLVSTVDDMLRWLGHMDEPRVGSVTTWDLIKSPQVLPNGTSTYYGFGLWSSCYRGAETLHHAGGVTGGNSQMLKVPAARLDITIMLNRTDISSSDFVDRILDSCLPGLDPVKKSSNDPFATGIYRSPTTDRVVQLFRSSASHPYVKEGQQIASIDGVDLPFAADGGGVLRPGVLSGALRLEMTLVGNPESPASIRFNDYGNIDELMPVHPVERSDVPAIVGSYRSDATGTEAKIADSEHGPQMRTIGRFGSAQFSLECVARGVWRFKATDPIQRVGSTGILLFEDDGATFRFSSLRTRALPFRRRS
jgi:D-aminopeptidase